MSWPNILGIAVGLAMDAFAVSIAAGLSIPRLTRGHVFRMAWHFGLFQSMMPIVGWLAGKAMARYIVAYDHWVAFSLLALIGGKMLYEAAAGGVARPKMQSDPTRGVTLLVLSVATSVDALAVGLSLAFLKVSIWLPAVVIGLVAGVLTMVGICFGNRLGERYEHWAQAAGGTVLLAIGVHILVSHLAG